jgi:hypothetical protein
VFEDQHRRTPLAILRRVSSRSAAIPFWWCVKISDRQQSLQNAQHACPTFSSSRRGTETITGVVRSHTGGASALQQRYTTLTCWPPRAYCSLSSVQQRATQPTGMCKAIGTVFLLSEVPRDGPSYLRKPWFRGCSHRSYCPACPCQSPSSAPVGISSPTSLYLRCLVIRIGII